MADETPARAHDPASLTLVEHYADYFATPEQLDWYRLMAVDKAQDVIDMCSDVPHESILDIGAGDGAVLHRLDSLGFGSRLHAIEISESGLRAIKDKSWRSLAESRLFDGSAIPYPDDTFDLAILSHVIEHLEHPRMALREAARVARHVYVEVPMEYALTNRRLRRDFALDATGHINFYNPMLIRLLVQSTGLRVLKQRVLHYTSKAYTRHKGRRGLINYWIKDIALRISPRLATKVFNYHCGLLCAKAAPTSTTP